MKLQITQMVNRGKHDYENVLISTLDNTNLLLSIHQDRIRTTISENQSPYLRLNPNHAVEIF